MEIRRFHSSTVDNVTDLVNELLPNFTLQAGEDLSNLEHEWDGTELLVSFTVNTLLGKLNIAATLTVTDSEVIITSKLPLRARMKEGQIRTAIEEELDRALESLTSAKVELGDSSTFGRTVQRYTKFHRDC